MNCPICKKKHITESKYSCTICEVCLNTYTLLNVYNEPVSFVNSNGVLYAVSDGMRTHDHDCILHGKPCYATMNEHGKIFIITCVPINKPIEKIKNLFKVT